MQRPGRASTRCRLNLSDIRLRSETARCEADEKPPLADWFSPLPNASSDFGDRRRRIANSTERVVFSTSIAPKILVIPDNYFPEQKTIPEGRQKEKGSGDFSSDPWIVLFPIQTGTSIMPLFVNGYLCGFVAHLCFLPEQTPL